MTRITTIVAIILGSTIIVSAKPNKTNNIDANGNEVIYRHAPNDISKGRARVYSSHGAVATVAAKHAERFQAYIDDLERNYGAKLYDIGGIRKGRCRPGGMHPCGRAIDLCQLGRGIVDRKCNLPDRGDLARIARQHGLFEGGLWCNHDYGHAQVGVSSPACGHGHIMVARAKAKKHTKVARRAVRYAYAPRARNTGWDPPAYPNF